MTDAIANRLIDGGFTLVGAVLVALIARTNPKKIIDQVERVEVKVDGNYSAMAQEIKELTSSVLALTGDKRQRIGKDEGIAQQKAEQTATGTDPTDAKSPESH